MTPNSAGNLPDSLHVVVVAYGRPDLLAKSLEALEQRFSLIVVDNSSQPEIQNVVKGAGGHYMDAGQNLGFAAAVNLALRRCGDEGDILLLNPDAVIGADRIGRLQECLRSDDRLACVAPRQVHPDSGRMERVSWPLPHPWHHWLEAIGLHISRGRPEFRIGSVLLLRRKALRDVGPLDERFFLYAEEADWQIRALAAGWRTKECSDVVAEHVGAGTATDEWIRRIRFHASHELLIRKHYGSSGWAVYRSAALAGAVVRAAVLTGHRRRDAWQRMQIYAVGPCRTARRTDPEARSRSFNPSHLGEQAR